MVFIALNSSTKKRNMLAIMMALRQGGPMSKPDIVRATGLTNVTVNNFVNELKDRSFVYEVGTDSSTGGRNACLYQFNSKRLYTAGLTIGISEIAFGLFDADLSQLYEQRLPLDLNSMTVEQGIDRVYDFVRQGLEEMPVRSDSLAGMGISVPGPVQYPKGVVCNLVNIPAWQNVPLKAILEKRLGLPVMVDKDNYCNVACLRWINPGEGNDNFVYLGLINGVGAGIVVNGRVLRGRHYILGELGHIGFGDCDGVCKCGNRGCVELAISDAFARAAAQGDAFARDNIYSCADMLTTLFDCAIKAYDPDKIVVHSLWMDKYPDFFNFIVNRIYEKSILFGRDDMIIELNEVDNLFLKGAATLVLDEQFSIQNPGSLLYKKEDKQIEQ